MPVTLSARLDASINLPKELLVGKAPISELKHVLT